jgi:hypothetical protein
LPQRLVLLDIGRAEILCQQTEAALAPEIDLPEPVARGIEALQEKQVVLVLRINMRNAPDVDQDLSACLQAGRGRGR